MNHLLSLLYCGCMEMLKLEERRRNWQTLSATLFKFFSLNCPHCTENASCSTRESKSEAGRSDHSLTYAISSFQNICFRTEATTHLTVNYTWSYLNTTIARKSTGYYFKIISLRTEILSKLSTHRQRAPK